MKGPFFRFSSTLFALLFPALGFANSNLATPAKVEAAYSIITSKPEAVAFLADQAEQNNPHAAFYMGVSTELGRGTAKNTRLALDYYRAAADKIREAAFNAGRLLYSMNRIDEASKYFVVAAGGDKADGIDRAMVMLGRIYEKGESVVGRNYVAAARWYEAAARRKDPVAVGKMGEFLLYGLGRQANARDAKIYLERAADMWNADAQYLLGEVFAKGDITQVNRTEAGKWYFIAASHSYDHKRRSLGFVTGLTAQELDSAQRMADLWISAHPRVLPIDYLAIIERLK